MSDFGKYTLDATAMALFGSFIYFSLFHDKYKKRYEHTKDIWRGPLDKAGIQVEDVKRSYLIGAYKNEEIKKILRFMQAIDHYNEDDRGRLEKTHGIRIRKTPENEMNLLKAIRSQEEYLQKMTRMERARNQERSLRKMIKRSERWKYWLHPFFNYDPLTEDQILAPIFMLPAQRQSPSGK